MRKGLVKTYERVVQKINNSQTVNPIETFLAAQWLKEIQNREKLAYEIEEN